MFVLINPAPQASVTPTPAPISPAPVNPSVPTPKVTPALQVLAPIEHVLSFSDSINHLDLALSGEAEILEGNVFWDSFDMPPTMIAQTIGLRFGVECLDENDGPVYSDPNDLASNAVPIKKLVLPYGDIGGRVPFFLLVPKGTHKISVHCFWNITITFTSRIIIKDAS